MSERLEVILAGNGGQGIVLAGVILAEAAATHDGRNAAQTQSYGPAARGGTCKAEIVISDREIDYPKVSRADVLLVMSQEACDEYCDAVSDAGLLIVDSVLVDQPPEAKAHHIPITRIAEQAGGRLHAANMVGLGIVVGLTGAVSPEAIESTVRHRVPAGSVESNLDAFRAGLDLGRQL